MKNFFHIFLAASLFCSSAFSAGAIGIIGDVQTITVGGHVFVDPYSDTSSGFGTFKILTCQASTDGRYCTFATFAGTAYQVPVGKKFYVYAGASVGGTASGGAGTVCYGDNDVGMNSSSAPTNVSYYGGSNSTAAFYAPLAFARTEAAFYYEIPAQKYPCYTAANSAPPDAVFIYGYEK